METKMFPIVHNVNQLIASVNVIKCDVQRLKAAHEASLDEDGNPIAAAHAIVVPAPPSIDVSQMQKEIADVSRSVSEMKRYVDALKVDIERTVSMTETTVLRKCEVALNRMVQDKIAVALDKERGQIQDRISDAVEEELDARSRRSPFADPRVQQQVLLSADLLPLPSMSTPYTTQADHPAHVSCVSSVSSAIADDNGSGTESYDVKLKSPNRKRGGAAHSRAKKLPSQ